MNALKCADSAIYYSNSRKVISRIQSEGRIRRDGSQIHDIITYWDIVTEGSIDSKIIIDIKGSISTANYIMSGIRSGQNLKKLIV